MVEGKVISIGNIAYCLGMNPKKVHRWYKEVLSGYKQAEQSGELYANDLKLVDSRFGNYDDIRVPIYKPQNMGKSMAIDEKQINGIMYSILSNRENGRIALMADTLEVKHLADLIYSFDKHMAVQSYTRDMAVNYDWLGRQVFMRAYHVADKFHVIRQALDSLQAIRIRYRQQELTKRREQGDKYKKIKLTNGDSKLELLARSRGLLFKNQNQWSLHQQSRSKVLFDNYPTIEKAYKIISSLRKWYQSKLFNIDAVSYTHLTLPTTPYV